MDNLKKIVVGFSGGPDSTCILHRLNSDGHELVAAHLDHCLLSHSAEVSEHCKRFCNELKIPIYIKKVDVKKLARQEGWSIEEAGRSARYSFFNELINQLGYDMIATGHTLDDHIETVLLNLTRGTGLKGICGIPQKRGNIIRPLLSWSREDVLSYCAENKLRTVKDPSNESLDFSRCRIRHHVIPELKKINPSLLKTAERFTKIVAEEDGFLARISHQNFEDCRERLEKGFEDLIDPFQKSYSAHKLLNLDDVLFKRGLRQVASDFGAKLSYDQVHSIFDGLQKNSSGSITAEENRIVVEWNTQKLIVRKLDVFSDLEWTLHQSRAQIEDYKNNSDRFQAFLDAKKIVGSLKIEFGHYSDKIDPVGLDGSKKIGKILNELGFKNDLRELVPVVYDSQGPLWVYGGPLSDRVCIDANTESVIQLYLEAH